MAPSPFRARTTLSFRLDEATPVRLGIYDVTGRRVSRLLDGRLAAGTHRVSWDGRDGGGRALPAGTYLVRLTRGEETTTGKIVRLD
jgi:flagellar hook assembly protein FlgD